MRRVHTPAVPKVESRLSGEMPTFILHLTAHFVLIHVVASRTNFCFHFLWPLRATGPTNSSHYFRKLLLLALAQGQVVGTRTSFEATTLSQKSRNLWSKVVRLLFLSLCDSLRVIVCFLEGTMEPIFSLGLFFCDLEKTNFGSFTFKNSLSPFSLFNGVPIFGIIGTWSRRWGLEVSIFEPRAFSPRLFVGGGEVLDVIGARPDLMVVIGWEKCSGPIA